ncbi:hypothetical protein ACFQL1_12550 [Halomicroarcula sp. GCM10025709]|uniref:hypothetical protein n=1 Tax=Haloarcula TaxID=2237 RepID=UPI0024C285AA|nr:hypothetical protein [Halomicroarcula sp. YJ-61-S]
MTLLRRLVQRLALGLGAAWVVLTAVFGLFTLTEDWVLNQRLGALKWAGTEEAALDRVRNQYLAARGLDRPLWVQYGDWLGNMVTLDWGTSFRVDEPVLGLVMGAVGRTAAYVLPALALAVAAGVALGVAAALRPDGRPRTWGSPGATSSSPSRTSGSAGWPSRLRPAG